MKWFLDRTTKTKLFLGFGLMFLFLLFVIVTAYSGITNIRKSQSELFQKDFLAANELIELKADQNRTRAQLLEMMILKDRAKQQVIKNDIMEKAKAVEEGLNKISEVLKEQPQELKKLEELISSRASYIKTRDEQIALIYAGKVDEA